MVLRCIAVIAAVVLAVFPQAASAGSCNFMPDAPRPAWINKPSIPGYYTGVGTASKRDTSEEMIEASQNNAIKEIMKSISVSSKSKTTDVRSTTDSGGVQQDIESETETMVEGKLRNVKVKDKWLDRKDCTLYTYIVVSEEDMQAVKKELEEEKRKKLTSKSLMLFALSRPQSPNEIETHVISAMEKVMREMDVKVVAPKAKYVPCARGEYSKLCDEQGDAIYGGFDMTFDNEKTSTDGTKKARFYKFTGALYLKDRRVSSFDLKCRGVGNVSQPAAGIDLAAADSCVSDIKKKLKADMQGSE